MTLIDRNIFTYESGEVIFREGDEGNSAYIIENGTIEVSISHGGERILLSAIGRGELFGEMAVIDDRPRTATATALESTRLIRITRDQINNHLEQGDSIVNLLLKVILERYRATLERYRQDGVPPLMPTTQPDFKTKVVTPQLDGLSKPAEAAIEAMRLEADLRDGIAKNEFVVFYQPIIDLSTRRAAGFEALVRWQHPKRGLLSPYHFIDLAEQTGQIVPLGDFVLEQACKDLPALQAAGNHCFDSDEALQPFMSVNVSGRQLGEEGYIDTIRDIIDITNVNPAQLKLEITESLFMENPETAVEWINHCRDMGLTIALDDFGTGFSSLGYLYQFPIDNLKIDRCFVTAMCESERAMKVVRAIAGLAHGLHLSVVAEGIEEIPQIASLARLGCTYGQGYLFAKPASIDDMTKLLKSEPDWHFRTT